MTKAAMILVIFMILTLELLFLCIISGFLYVALRSVDPISDIAFRLGAAIMIFIALLFNCLLYCYWDELSIAISIVNAAADFVVATTRIIYISLNCVLIGSIVLYLSLQGLIYIISVNIID